MIITIVTSTSIKTINKIQRFSLVFYIMWLRMTNIFKNFQIKIRLLNFFKIEIRGLNSFELELNFIIRFDESIGKKTTFQDLIFKRNKFFEQEEVIPSRLKL